MKLISSACSLAVFWLVFTPVAIAQFVPLPQSLHNGQGELLLREDLTVHFGGREAPRHIETSLKPLADVLAEDIELLTGFRPAVEMQGAKEIRPGDIVLDFAPIEGAFAATEAEEQQSYRLEVDQHVKISSPYFKGVAYGTATLLQSIRLVGEKATLPKLVIEDESNSAFRCIMLDIARQPHSLGAIQDVINLARLYKIRYVQLHLTDDQNFTFPFEPVISALKRKGISNSSFTRQEMLELVQFADARGVTLIPELDLPGHSSMLLKSGYLEDDPETDGLSHADVASSLNAKKIERIVDDMLEVFQSSPYFHIGGDESSAGAKLVPFLERTNAFLRGKQPEERKRLLVWEGFHGSPTVQLPATGDDRVIVMSWEGGAYNAPWNLLKNGYQVVNASWKPLYIVGGGYARLPHYSMRRWPAELIYSWDKDSFMHWQPGIPIYEDRGPSDPDKTDSTWKASYIGRSELVIGGQLLFWEHSEKILMPDLLERIAAFSDRLWNPSPQRGWPEFDKVRQSTNRLAKTLVQPVEISPESNDPLSPVSADYAIYSGDQVSIQLRNRSAIQGQIRYVIMPVRRQIANFDSGPLELVDAKSELYLEPIQIARDGFAIGAKLFRADGTAVRGQSYRVYNNFPQTVVTTIYERSRDEFPASEREVPDFENFVGKRAVVQIYQTPWLRGNWTHTERSLQRQDATWRVKQPGEYQFECKADSGRASVYVDLNQNGVWETDEKLITTLPKEERVSVTLALEPGDYPIRVDHVTELVRPVLITSIIGPDSDGRRQDISHFLVPIAGEKE